jgi:hypothetical protein
MAIYYLDVDDEITSAASRIRDSSDTHIALVIQGGSRVATSRINFRLLAREAHNRGRRLAIVAADASVRSLAQTAGLPVYAAVGDYQRAEAARPAGSQPGGTDAVSDALDQLAATIDVTGAGAGTAGAARSRAGGSGKAGTRSSANGHGFGLSRVLAVGLAATLIVAGFGAYLFWPSATVVLTLREEPVGPMTITVKVDPAAKTTSDVAATVPGMAKAFPLNVSGTFDATGQNVVETAATGTVTFRNSNNYLSVPVLAGTRVSTAGGVAFTTTSTVTVPKAALLGTTITPGTAEVAIAAVDKGLSGNVDAGAIVRVPSDLASALVGGNPVTNKKATSGGTHTVTPFVQQADIDSAEASLASELDASFRSNMTEPASISAGLELFPSSGHLDAAAFSPDPATLLNQAVASFDLSGTSTGTATVADLATVRSLAERRIRAGVAEGHSLVEGSVSVALGSPSALGSVVSVPVMANAFQAPTVDVDQLRAAIKGKSVADAKAYLSKYGDAQISVSPFWASTVSGFDFRIDLQVLTPTAQPTAVGSQGAGLSRETTPSEIFLPASPVPSKASATAGEPTTSTLTPESTASTEASPTATP